jgi:phosphoenolpyruvate carboxylase
MSKLRLRAPYVVPLNVLQVLSMASIRGLGPNTSTPTHSKSALRTQRSFKPDSWNAYADPDTLNLLNRDPENMPDKDLLLQAYHDTLIITIKGIAAGMQNTG